MTDLVTTLLGMGIIIFAFAAVVFVVARWFIKRISEKT